MGETLTADVSDIDDADGRDNATFSYQWQANDSDIPGATDSTYTLVADDVGKTVKVKVSFTDDAGNPETLTSGATDAVAEWPADPLTATLENTPEFHDGEDPFTFELRFSEEFGLSYVTLRDDHAFTVTGGTVTRARRLERPQQHPLGDTRPAGLRIRRDRRTAHHRGLQPSGGHLHGRR